MRAFVLAICLAGGPAAAQEFLAFKSPSGNIACMIFAGGGYSAARCDIAQATPSFRRPADCDLDWGHAFEVGASGSGYPVCAGDTVFEPGAPVLGYGRYVTLGGFTCTSERTGMTCVNAMGHGFSVARAAQRVF